MDKKTKKLIVVIIVLALSIVCTALGVSLGVPIEVLVPLGTEIIDGLSADQPGEDAPLQNQIFVLSSATISLRLPQVS